MIRVKKAISVFVIAGLLTSGGALADDGPIATNVTGIKNQLIATPVIADAPADDFNRVAWCHGALSGHMDLAEHITEVEPLSEDMQKIGASYLRAYEASLTLSKLGETPEGRTNAEAARQKGFEGWAEARNADKGKAAGAYVNWSLPGDCERAAKTLSGHPDIFKEMQTEEEASIIAEALKPSAERKTLDVFTPKKVNASVAPTNADEAIGNSRVVTKTEVKKDKGNWTQGLMSKLGWGKKDGE